MIYGIALYFIIIFVSIYSRTYTYVAEEHRQGMSRLIAVIIGTVVLCVLLILAVKIILGSI